MPAPPVTVIYLRQQLARVRESEKRVRFVPCHGVHVLIALPLTWNLYATLWAPVRLSGGGLGAVNGFAAVESAISGSCRLTSEARSSAFSGMVVSLEVSFSVE